MSAGLNQCVSFSLVIALLDKLEGHNLCKVSSEKMVLVCKNFQLISSSCSSFNSNSDIMVLLKLLANAMVDKFFNDPIAKPKFLCLSSARRRKISLLDTSVPGSRFSRSIPITDLKVDTIDLSMIAIAPDPSRSVGVYDAAKYWC